VARAHVRSTIYFFRDEQRGEAPFFTSRLLDFVGVGVLSFFSGFFCFLCQVSSFCRRGKGTKTFKGKKKRDDGGGKEGVLCPGIFSFLVFFVF
jgi:hypothetical protein